MNKKKQKVRQNLKEILGGWRGKSFYLVNTETNMTD
jgi:hypothetical protein